MAKRSVGGEGKHRYNVSLMWKILAAMLAVILVAMIFTGVVLYLGVRSNVESNAAASLSRYARQIKPIAEAIISTQGVAMRWDIRQSSAVTGIVIFNADKQVLFPSEEMEIKGMDVFQRVSGEFVDDVLAGKTAQGKMGTDRDDFLLVGEPVLDTDGNVIGGVILSRPLTEVNGLSDTIIELMLLAFAAAAAVAIGVGLFLSRRITQPVIKLKNAAEKLSQGDFGVTADIRNHDEIGMLAGSFNSLSATLSATIAELNESNAKLRSDMAEIQKLEQLRRDYIANVSHEFRAPITGIRGFIEPLQDGLIQTEEERAESYRIIYEETLRMERLINAMLELSRLQSGKTQMPLERMDASEIIRSTAGRFAERCHKKGQTLTVEIMPGLPPVLGNEDRIDQVLVILLDNAVKYTQEGGHIAVRMHDADGCVVVDVADDGPGIAGDDLPYVFERFFKSDRAHSRDGAGLGLSIAHEIVALWGGTISAQSNGGTTFTFTIKKA